MAQLCMAALDGDFAGARELHFQLLPWMRAAFVESNPIPVKAAMHLLGRMENRLRLPLVAVADKHVETIRDALQTAGALS
jgi:4-hydroxy-tetrahydrodipicolinate synthase